MAHWDVTEAPSTLYTLRLVGSQLHGTPGTAKSYILCFIRFFAAQNSSWIQFALQNNFEFLMSLLHQNAMSLQPMPCSENQHVAIHRCDVHRCLVLDQR